MSPITLTEEQRLRIEANRQRALAIRQAREASADAVNSNGISHQKTSIPVRQDFRPSSKPVSRAYIQSNNPSEVVSKQLELTTIKLSASISNNGSTQCIAKSNSQSLNAIENSKSNQNPLTKGFSAVSSSGSFNSKSTEPSKSFINMKSTATNQAIFSSRVPLNPSTVKSSNSQASTSNQGKLSQSFYGGYQKSPSAVSSNFYGKSNSTVSPTHGQGSTLSVTTAKPPPVCKPVNGTFCLVSTDRFVAQVGYHQTLIDMFKTVQSRQYDTNTKQWSFSIEDHDDLVKKITPMRPAVCISPLASNVLKVLQEAKCCQPLDSVDLSGLDPRLREALLPFQRDGVRFGIRQQGRVLIADDMGLGKTIQALGIASHYRSEWPLLVVTPSSVRYSWRDALERWLGVCTCNVINSSQDPIAGYDVIITSYDLLSRRAKEFKDNKFGVAIMDESHMLKNFKSARYKAASPLMKAAKRVILLSGTPALSRPSELHTQISSVDPRLFPKYQDYGVRYCAGKMGPWGWDFGGSSNLEELQVLLQSKIMIRRLKTEVLEQLPAKQRKVVILDPNSITASTSKELKASAAQLDLKSLKGADRHCALLQFFAQTASAKLKAVSDYVKEMLEGDHKFLVFAHHRVMLDHLCQACEKAKAMYIRIEGSTPGDTRQALVDEFQQRADVRVAVLSITAASTGITLTAANLVVFAELYWNPGILVQAEDRVHRLGQRDCVSVHYLVAKGTADDHIWPMVQHKLSILGKAGLSKDDFTDSDASYQKSKTSSNGSILPYLEDLRPEELDEMARDFDDESFSFASETGEDAAGAPTKKQKIN